MITCIHCGRQNKDGSLFCASCGCGLVEEGRPAVRLVWQDETTGEEKAYLLSDVERYVGRDAANDIVVDDEQVSSRHMKIVYEEEGFWVEELGSKNGTFVNGERVVGTRKLEDEDLVKVGQTIFKFTG